MRPTTLISKRLILALTLPTLIGVSVVASVSRAQVKPSPAGHIYYVRQTVGDDANDGLSPKTAWRHVARLQDAMGPGDTAYVGPGLYREQVSLGKSGTKENRLTFIADSTGQQTGDPPGVVMLAGTDPVDTKAFTPTSTPGVYKMPLPTEPELQGVVEMDGDQYRYLRVRNIKDFPKGTDVPATYSLDTIAKTPATFFPDEDAKILYIHTSDGKPPSVHQIELLRRSSGFLLFGKRYVTIIGFTFRHMGDAGIDFWRAAGDGIAINNTAYGSRQGIRAVESPNVLIYGNTLFRNENSGAYFLRQSTDGVAIGNIAYENVKGLRWGSQSVNGVALDNTLFDNHERGLSIEDTGHMLVRGNRLVNNAQSQLLVLESVYGSTNNCFENAAPQQLTADFSLVSFIHDRYKTLAEYQKVKHQDLDSREGTCGPPPQKIDVRKLHAETMSYPERAQKLLGVPSTSR